MNLNNEYSRIITSDLIILIWKVNKVTICYKHYDITNKVKDFSRILSDNLFVNILIRGKYVLVGQWR